MRLRRRVFYCVSHPTNRESKIAVVRHHLFIKNERIERIALEVGDATESDKGNGKGTVLSLRTDTALKVADALIAAVKDQKETELTNLLTLGDSLNASK